jgi:hypothetical protein
MARTSRLLLMVLILGLATTIAPRAVAAQAPAVCGASIVDFREMVRDESGRPVLDEAGRPRWQPATATGFDGSQHQLTSAYFRPPVLITHEVATLQPLVSFEFTDEGASLMAQISERNLGRPLGIFVDDRLVSAPTIGTIVRERAVITGVDETQARDNADRVNASLAGCGSP